MTRNPFRPVILSAVMAALIALSPAGHAETVFPVTLQPVTEWKSVFGRIEPRREVPARARLGGTLEMLEVVEGDMVEAGQMLGRIENISLQFQLAANEAQLDALRSQLANAETELTRGEELLERGVTTAQRIDALRTQVEVLQNQIGAAEAQGRVIGQQLSEGAVLAPITGRVLAVPVASGAVVMPGEQIAMVGGGGIFLRLAVPERHAGLMAEGDMIEIAAGTQNVTGRLARIYPRIENGRVLADVEVEDLDDRFVNARVLVRLPISSREAILVPERAITQRFGLDYIRLATTPQREIVVQPGDSYVTDEGDVMIEILAGLGAGDAVVLP